MPPGEYQLFARRADGSLTQGGEAATAKTGDHAVRLVVQEPSSITGRVIFDGKPVPYYGVIVTSSLDDLWGAAPAALRAADGRFTRSGVAPGSWIVSVMGPGFANKVISGIDVKEGKVTDLGDVVVDRGIRVRGRVTDGSARRS